MSRRNQQAVAHQKRQHDLECVVGAPIPVVGVGNDTTVTFSDKYVNSDFG